MSSGFINIAGEASIHIVSRLKKGIIILKKMKTIYSYTLTIVYLRWQIWSNRSSSSWFHTHANHVSFVFPIIILWSLSSVKFNFIVMLFQRWSPICWECFDLVVKIEVFWTIDYRFEFSLHFFILYITFVAHID